MLAGVYLAAEGLMKGGVVERRTFSCPREVIKDFRECYAILGNALMTLGRGGVREELGRGAVDGENL